MLAWILPAQSQDEALICVDARPKRFVTPPVGTLDLGATPCAASGRMVEAEQSGCPRRA